MANVEDLELFHGKILKLGIRVGSFVHKAVVAGTCAGGDGVVRRRVGGLLLPSLPQTPGTVNKLNMDETHRRLGRRITAVGVFDGCCGTIVIMGSERTVPLSFGVMALWAHFSAREVSEVLLLRGDVMGQSRGDKAEHSSEAGWRRRAPCGWCVTERRPDVSGAVHIHPKEARIRAQG